MPSAFDSQPIGYNDPNQRLDFATSKLPLPTPLDIIAAFGRFLEDTGLQVIANLTGIDLRTLKSFLDPIHTLLDQVRGALEGIDLSIIGAVPLAIASAIQDLIATFIQPIIDGIIGAITGAGQIGNDITALIQTLLNPLNAINSIMGFIQNLGELFGGQAGALDARLSALEASVLGAKGLVSADNFNRPTLGPTWTNVAGSLEVQGNDFVRSGGFSAGYYNADEPDTDRHGASIRIVSKLAGSCRVFISGNAAMTNYIAVDIQAGWFGQDAVTLMVGSSPTTLVGVQQVAFTDSLFGQNGLRDGDVIGIRYDDVANNYQVLRNNQVIIDWPDEDNLVTHGAGKRKTGIVTNGWNQPLQPGPGVTDFVFYDWNVA